MKNYYEILGIRQNFSSEEIRRAFRKKAKKVHPDLYQNEKYSLKLRMQKEFIILTQAYQTLSNPEFRYKYDIKLNNYYNTKIKINKKNTHRENSFFKNKEKKTLTPEEALNDLKKETDIIIDEFDEKLNYFLEKLITWSKNIYHKTDSKPIKQNNFVEEMLNNLNVNKIFKKLEKKLNDLNFENNLNNNKKINIKKKLEKKIDEELKNLKTKYKDNE